MLHKEIPFLRILIPLCAGIIAGLYTDPDKWYVLISSLVCIILILYSGFIKEYRQNNLFGISLTLSLIICGYLLYKIHKGGLTTLDNSKTDIICTISDFPEERENSYRIFTDLNAVIRNGEISGVKGAMLFYFRKDSPVNDLLPGDIIKIRCTPSEIKNRGNPFEFDYRQYLENKGIKYMSFNSREDIESRISPSKRKIKHRALIIRERLLEMYKNRGVEGRNLALVAAMSLGEKSLLEQDQKEIFIRAGVMHIMAVSGLHAVVLSMFVFNLLFFLKKRFSIIQILSALLILWAFAFITGLTPSVMRATLMFSFLQAGKLLKRPASSMNSVLASAFVLILIRPAVIFDAGFLLSYSAVIFIIAFYRNICSIFCFRNRITNWIWQSAALTLVAQAGTLSLTIMFFNRFPVYFLLTNLIIVPLASVVIITGSLIPMFYPVAFVSGFFARILIFFTSLVEKITATVSSLPGASIEEIGMKLPESILLLTIIALLLSASGKKEYRPFRLILALLLVFSVISTARTIITKRTNELIVYNIPGSTTIGIRSGRYLDIYSSENDIPPEIKRHCAIQNLKPKKLNYESGQMLIEAGYNRILIADSIDGVILSELNPDFVVLSGKRPVIRGFSTAEKHPVKFITSSEIVSGYRLPEKINSQLIQPVHYIRTDGAFMKDLTIKKVQ